MPRRAAGRVVGVGKGIVPGEGPWHDQVWHEAVERWGLVVAHAGIPWVDLGQSVAEGGVEVWQIEVAQHGVG